MNNSPYQSSQRDADNLSEKLPWGRIASFLSLEDMLSMRLVSSIMATSVYEGTLPENCAAWLGEVLRKRNVFMIPGCLDWKQASNSETEVLRTPFEGRDQAPLDCLLRCLRVCKYIPEEAAVGFSGRFGRHIMPLSDGQVRFFPECRRGKKQCASCRTRILRKPRRSNHLNHDADGEEDERPVKLEDVLQIAVNKKEILDLDQYYLKCVPNLPRDLVCPLCRVSDRRTLILTELTYQTPEETAQGALRNLLTFTPCEEPPSKKPRLEGHCGPDVHATFPPMNPHFFIPGAEPRIPPPREDFKHAIAVHCADCRMFGMLAPSGLCFGPRRIGDGCGGKFNIGDACGSSVGAILCRRSCSRPSCLHALACSHCRETASPECCPECHNHDESLRWHA